MSFKINNKQLLKKYNQIWKKIAKLLKIEFDSKPVYIDDNKYIKTKIKSSMQVFVKNNARFCYLAFYNIILKHF